MDLFSISVTGMQAQMNSLAVIGNNISNASTCGFKASNMSFTELYTTQSGQYANGILNQVGNGVQTSGTTTNWTSGSIESTGADSNLAINGDGFLPVEYNGQIVYTRAGDFSLVGKDIDGDGTNEYVFMLPNGAILLGGSSNGDGTATISSSSYVSFDTAPTSYDISSNGVVTAVGATVTNGQLAIQRFNNPDSLERHEGGLYTVTNLTSYNTSNPAIPGELSTGTLSQGSLEKSNTDLTDEFTKLIQAQRAFQACSKGITTADQMLQTILQMIN